MHVARLMGPVVLALGLSGAAFGQAWIEYKNLDDRFTVNFPGEPKIESLMYTAEDGNTFPAHRYSASRGKSTYTLTVVDFHTSDSVATVRGSIAFAAMNQRKLGKVTYDAYGQVDRIEGMHLQITKPNGQRLFTADHLEDRRLYILEATVPASDPPPEAYVVSLGILDAKGNGVRYNLDFDGVRTRVGGGRDLAPTAAGGGGRGAGGGANEAPAGAGAAGGGDGSGG